MNYNLDFLKKIKEISFEESTELTKYSTMRLKSCGNLVKIFSINALQKILNTCLNRGIPYQLIGWGANQLLPLKYKGLYLKLELPFDKGYLDKIHNQYILPASVSLSVLSAHAIRYGLKGWEVFTGIPASLGGAVYMNAGTDLGEIGSLVEKVKIVTKEGNIREEIINDTSFSYRKNHFVEKSEVIVEVKLIHFGEDSKVSSKIKEYLKYRNTTQPLKEFTCGCMFKNYHSDRLSCKAGHSVDIMGLKGLGFNGVRVSPLHANFMENREGASLQDVKALVGFVQEELMLQLGIGFKTEVIIPEAE